VNRIFTVFFLGFTFAAGDLLGIPTVPFTDSGDYFKLSSLSGITVDTKHCEDTDTNGHTLIPPTLLEFANTFASDLETTGCHAKVNTGLEAGHGDIFVTIGNNSEFVDAAGRWTAEAYSLNVSTEGITITGASPLGAWWATRSILQQAALNNGSVPTGYGVDAPGWGTRGIMVRSIPITKPRRQKRYWHRQLDCGRHYYPPEFIVELCTWQSYWKENVFHFHLSDNLYNNPNYTYEEQMSLYARFRLWSDDPRVQGLNKYANESYTRKDFDYIQSSCAARGVTVIPEIESPGHALVISQWKPELGLQDSLDQLNISYPDTIPTVKAIWDVFTPWFKSKVLEIGADEYSDESLTA
jgi:hexosaminidase